jgi:hypothetical protein
LLAYLAGRIEGTRAVIPFEFDSDLHRGFLRGLKGLTHG